MNNRRGATLSVGTEFDDRGRSNSARSIDGKGDLAIRTDLDDLDLPLQGGTIEYGENYTDR